VQVHVQVQVCAAAHAAGASVSCLAIFFGTTLHQLPTFSCGQSSFNSSSSWRAKRLFSDKPGQTGYHSCLKHDTFVYDVLNASAPLGSTCLRNQETL
jgi:hypothetical protein